MKKMTFILAVALLCSTAVRADESALQARVAALEAEVRDLNHIVMHMHDSMLSISHAARRVLTFLAPQIEQVTDPAELEMVNRDLGVLRAVAGYDASADSQMVEKQMGTINNKL